MLGSPPTLSERLDKPNRDLVRATTIRKRERRVLPAGTPIARIHRLAGGYATAWNELRRDGPTTTSRFDHHPPPARVHATHSIAYLTYGKTQFLGALAEAFQRRGGGVRPIDRVDNSPAVTLFELADEIALLNLDSGWVTRAGGNQAITSGARGRAREWARAIYAEHDDVMGLAYRSSVWARGRCIALWDRGASAFPKAPLTTRLLADDAMDIPLDRAAAALGTRIVTP